MPILSSIHCCFTLGVKFFRESPSSTQGKEQRKGILHPSEYINLIHYLASLSDDKYYERERRTRCLEWMGSSTPPLPLSQTTPGMDYRTYTVVYMQGIPPFPFSFKEGEGWGLVQLWPTLSPLP